MKVALISIMKRPTLKLNRVMSFETIKLFNIMKHHYDDAYVIGNKIASDKYVDKYIDIFSDFDINEYNIIFLQLTPINFFGGVLTRDQYYAIKKLLNFKNKIFCIINDPAIHHYNFVKIINKRIENNSLKPNFNDFIPFTKNDEIIFENLNYNFIFPGIDFKKYINHLKLNEDIIPYNENKVHYYNLFKEYFSDEKEIDDNNEKIYDVCYFGNNRSSNYRNKNIKKYLNIDFIKKYFIGYKCNFPNQVFLKYIKKELLLNEINKAWCSLIVSDKAHEDNIVIYLVYESILANTLLLIDNNYDKNKVLIKDELLRKYVYINSSYDIKKILSIVKNNKSLYHQLLVNQLNEYKTLSFYQ